MKAVLRVFPAQSPMSPCSEAGSFPRVGLAQATKHSKRGTHSAISFAAVLLCANVALFSDSRAAEKSPSPSTTATNGSLIVSLTASASDSKTNTAATPAIRSEYGADGLRMNFHGASLNLVLDYLSDAAGF